MFKSHRSLILSAVFSLSLLLTGGFFSRLEARAGDLDPTFDLDGMVTTDFFGKGGRDFAEAMAIQQDGKIVAAGYHGDGFSYTFALARYCSNGHLDDGTNNGCGMQGFGTGGVVALGFWGNAHAKAIVIQQDGKIVAAGGREFSFALARYNTDGSLDKTFGINGFVGTDFGRFEHESIQGLAIQQDGKIVAAGFIWAHGDGWGWNNLLNFALARYCPNGHLDDGTMDGCGAQGFGAKGMIMTDFSRNNIDSNDGAQKIAIQQDGKIVAAGFTLMTYLPERTVEYDFALARYNTDGSLDKTFGVNGLVRTGFSVGFHRDDWASALTIQQDGKIVAAGYHGAGGDLSGGFSDDFALARYNTDGSLDKTFGIDGMVTTDFSGDGGSGDEVYDIATQCNGKIVVAGFTTPMGRLRANDLWRAFDFALARYNTDGSLDKTFGISGLVTTDFSGNESSHDTANAIALQHDGRIVTAGYSNVNGSDDFALARYKGDPDISGKYDYSLTALLHDAPFSEGCPIGFECVKPITDCNANDPHLFGPVTGLINLKQQCGGKLTGDIGFFGGKQIPLNGSVDFGNNYWSFTVDEHQEQFPNPDGTVCTLSVSALFSGKVEPFDCSWGGGAVVTFTKVNGNCDSIMGQKNQCLVAYDKAVCTKQ